jgi:ABC-type phosphonate transport system ATPase subunit
LRSEATGFEQAPGDVIGEVAEAKCGAGKVLEALAGDFQPEPVEAAKPSQVRRSEPVPAVAASTSRSS